MASAGCWNKVKAMKMPACARLPSIKSGNQLFSGKRALCGKPPGARSGPETRYCTNSKAM